MRMFIKQSASVGSAVAIVTILCILETNTALAALPGDACANDEDCNPASTFLMCDAATNKCICEEYTYFETEDGRCHRLTGTLCSPEPIYSPCPLNGRCDPIGGFYTCTCLPGYSETSSEKCAKQHGQDCAASADCDRDSFEVCYGYMCDCELSTAVYDETTTKCGLLLHQPCDLSPDSQTCAPRSECREETNGAGFQCLCSDGYVDGGTGTCVEDAETFLVAGQYCNPLNDLCDHDMFLHCDPMTVKCVCMNYTVIVEDSAGNCRRRANAPCSVEAGAQPCTVNSKCTHLEPDYRCLCDDGLSHNGAGRCVLGYGATCKSGLPDFCDNENLQFCNPLENRCNCFDLMHTEFDFVREKCYLRPNSTCIPGSTIECQQNFVCDPVSRTCVNAKSG